MMMGLGGKLNIAIDLKLSRHVEVVEDPERGQECTLFPFGGCITCVPVCHARLIYQNIILADITVEDLPGIPGVIVT